jgi:large repetitive protein
LRKFYAHVTVGGTWAFRLARPSSQEPDLGALHDEENSMAGSTRRIYAAVGMALAIGSFGLAAQNTATAAIVRPNAATTRPSHAVPATGGNPSTTGLNILRAAVSYGEEDVASFDATVAGTGPGPTGTVEIQYQGATICSITLGGTDACQIGANQLPQTNGPVTITASYSGDIFYAPSSGTAQFYILPVSTTTQLDSAPTSLDYGAGGTAFWSVATDPSWSGSGWPEGTVSVATVGGSPTTLCSKPATAGPGTCDLTTPPPGFYQIQASYSDSANGGNFSSSSSSPQALTINQATTTTGLKLSAVTVTYGREKSERLKVTVGSSAAGLSGRVIIKAKAAHHAAVKVCTITLTNGAGSCTLKKTALNAGKYSVTATFTGNADFAPSAAPSKKLVIRK